MTTDGSGALETVIAARDRWLGATAAERAELGPGAIAACAETLHVLAGRLADLDYPVARPFRPCADLEGALAELDAAGITVPPAAVALWREVGSVCLVDLEHHRHVGFWASIEREWREANPDREPPTAGWCCDGVVIDGPVDEGWVDFVIDVVEDLADSGLDPAIELAPDALHKDDISGSGPYELVLPAPGSDPWLAVFDGGFRWSEPRPRSAPATQPDLVSYLRTALLECGGFPGLSGHPAFAEVLRSLTLGLPVF